MQAEGAACVADATCSGCTASNAHNFDYSTVQECTQADIRAAFGSLQFLNTTACVAVAANAQSLLSVWLDCAAADALNKSTCRLNKFCSTPVSNHWQPPFAESIAHCDSRVLHIVGKIVCCGVLSVLSVFRHHVALSSINLIRAACALPFFFHWH
jgi:hypothetical protein